MNRNLEVDAWLADYENPMKPVVLAMREHILGCDKRHGKWIISICLTVTSRELVWLF